MIRMVEVTHLFKPLHSCSSKKSPHDSLYVWCIFLLLWDVKGSSKSAIITYAPSIDERMQVKHGVFPMQWSICQMCYVSSAHNLCFGKHLLPPNLFSFQACLQQRVTISDNDRFKAYSHPFYGIHHVSVVLLHARDHMFIFLLHARGQHMLLWDAEIVSLTVHPHIAGDTLLNAYKLASATIRWMCKCNVCSDILNAFADKLLVRWTTLLIRYMKSVPGSAIMSHHLHKRHPFWRLKSVPDFATVPHHHEHRTDSIRNKHLSNSLNMEPKSVQYTHQISVHFAECTAPRLHFFEMYT